jgi:hypothetical protein
MHSAKAKTRLVGWGGKYKPAHRNDVICKAISDGGGEVTFRCPRCGREKTYSFASVPNVRGSAFPADPCDFVCNGIVILVNGASRSRYRKAV